MWSVGRWPQKQAGGKVRVWQCRNSNHQWKTQFEGEHFRWLRLRPAVNFLGTTKHIIQNCPSEGQVEAFIDWYSSFPLWLGVSPAAILHCFIFIFEPGDKYPGKPLNKYCIKYLESLQAPLKYHNKSTCENPAWPDDNHPGSSLTTLSPGLWLVLPTLSGYALHREPSEQHSVWCLMELDSTVTWRQQVHSGLDEATLSLATIKAPPTDGH